MSAAELFCHEAAKLNVKLIAQCPTVMSKLFAARQREHRFYRINTIYPGTKLNPVLLLVFPCLHIGRWPFSVCALKGDPLHSLPYMSHQENHDLLTPSPEPLCNRICCQT